jgi:PST family polysaccharide transporter
LLASGSQEAEPTPASKSYGQILKSSALIGGSTLVSLAFNIIRIKAMALMLGPAGVGYFGIYTSIADLGQCLAGLGVNNSGVRQIAEAASSKDAARIARTAKVLRWIMLLLGVAGALLFVLASFPISRLTFGDGQHALAIALLGGAVFFRLVSAGQTALIQGLRRIADLARLGMFGAFFGMLLGIPIVYVWREQGIVPSMVAVAAATALTAWWYSRRIEIADATVHARDFRREAAGFLSLGLAFMASELLALTTAYLVRLLLLYNDGAVGAGLYQAAWALGGMYAGFILQAMGADFYPRLTAAATNNTECERLINEQAEIGMLLAFPGVVATLTLAPLIMTLFYSAEFNAAADVLRWLCLGIALRVVAWPLGYLLIAKGASRIFVSVDIVAATVQLTLSAIMIPRLGPAGAGIAFFGMYIFHTLLVYIIARRMIGFRVSQENVRIFGIFISTIAVVFCSLAFLPVWPATIVGCVGTAASGLFVSRSLISRIPPTSWPASIRRWFPPALLRGT